MEHRMTYDQSSLLVKSLANATLFFAGVGLSTVATKLAHLFF